MREKTAKAEVTEWTERTRKIDTDEAFHLLLCFIRPNAKALDWYSCIALLEVFHVKNSME